MVPLAEFDVADDDDDDECRAIDSLYSCASAFQKQDVMTMISMVAMPIYNNCLANHSTPLYLFIHFCVDSPKSIQLTMA